MLDWLSGKKTFIISWTGMLAGLFSGVSALAGGEMSIMQFLSSEQLQMALEFAGLGGIRAGIAKILLGR